MKIMSSGMSVLRIQNESCSGRSNRNSMPAFSGSEMRNIRPRLRSAAVRAISTGTVMGSRPSGMSTTRAEAGGV